MINFVTGDLFFARQECRVNKKNVRLQVLNKDFKLPKGKVFTATADIRKALGKTHQP